ncbi:rhodanese-like domain-containing protein [Hymenobacter sp. 15J16-1T3B]|uniref:rhodanese-like domain-containing protein n=1 Tax=Hymenobacter sp. 15J16-1T3B TaxID=2886941 RepID=UPI001D12722A|nr:rhodanese-like domain-containing protein [Hymenobacter sp. 15J16-1T3B]MCC3157035.1 rhodanese-like domain-containing protein [Hymenobacter sp. 15J16-1T3B]
MKQLLPFFFALMLALTAAAAQAQTAPTVTPAQAQQQLAKPGVILLDVRTPAEFAAGHLRGARNVNFLSTDFADQVAKLDPNASYVLYCKSGNRATQAGTLMLQNGFKTVVNAGGFEALKAAGLAVE